jgi:alcohol dehydrogenase
MDFVEALVALQKACGVADLKMSDYGIQEGEMAKYAANARTTMGGLFKFDPAPLTDADSEAILKASWR